MRGRTLEIGARVFRVKSLGRIVTEALAAAIVTLVVTAAGEQITAEYGGLHPLLLHAAVLGVLGGATVWLLSRLRIRSFVYPLCAVFGAVIWTGSTTVNLAVRENLSANLD